jgi:short-subunit dehydrogenase involved in D-alanine esterification of teichoic acids
MKTNGNTMLITGGTSGIGLATAKLFMPNNTVIVTGKTKQKIDNFRTAYPNAEAIYCNFDDEADIDALVQVVAEKYPQLNILINNAGVQHNYYIQNEVSISGRVKNEININLTGQILLTLKLLPMLMQKKEAAILNTTSALAITPKSDAIMYCATKAALHSFTKGLRYQLENTNIKVLEIMPPLVDTRMTAGRGKGKISPKAMAKLIYDGLREDKQLITTPKIKFLALLNRIVPSLASKILK